MSSSSSDANSKFAELYNNNFKVLKSLEVGDLVIFPRRIVNHWAVYIGLEGDDDPMIIHLNRKHGIQKQRLFDVLRDSKMKKGNDLDSEFKPLEPSDIAERATSHLNEKHYDILSYNCEHFANWCRYDKKVCNQLPDAVQNCDE